MVVVVVLWFACYTMTKIRFLFLSQLLAASICVLWISFIHFCLLPTNFDSRSGFYKKINFSLSLSFFPSRKANRTQNKNSFLFFCWINICISNAFTLEIIIKYFYILKPFEYDKFGIKFVNILYASSAFTTAR